MTKINFKPIVCLALAATALSCGGGTKEEDKKNKEEAVADTTNTSYSTLKDVVLPENQNQIELEKFFRKPEKSGFKISPNGEYLAFKQPWKERQNIFIQKIGSDEITQITKVEDRDMAGFFWINDDRLVYMKDDGGDENFYLVAVNKDGSNEKELTHKKDVVTQIIDDLEDDPTHMIVGLNERIPQVFDAYRLNVETGELKMIAENPGNYMSWLTDHNGKLRIAIATDGVETTLMHRATEDEEFKEVLTTDWKESFNPLFFTFDNKQVYGSSNIGRDKSALVKFDLETGKEVEELYSHDLVDVAGLSYSRKRKVLTAISYNYKKQEKEFLDPVIEGYYNDLRSQLGDELEIALTSVDDNEEKVIVRTYSDVATGKVYFYNTSTKELKELADLTPWLPADKMAPMKPITYKSRDGLTIHGYLTLPVGVEAKNLPVVINPHGGPSHRDSWGFNPEIQLLANRGFAVLQMNFRGSTGYGREFLTSGYGKWGKEMQDDITDGVNWLIDQGIADKEKVAIYGASYGGYATLAGLCFTPDVYACGVDYVGVSNLNTLVENIPAYWEPFKAMLYEMIGDPVADSTHYREASPVYHADKIKAPLFIAQGANDPRVKKMESDQMVEAMKANGTTVEYMVKNNEGHGFRNKENQLDFYRTMEKFLYVHMLKD